MNNSLMECFTNPVKNKLFSQIDAQGQTTAKALAQHIDGVPQATLYRYLRKMVEDGILEVVEERQVRNVREKVYRVAIDFDAEVKKMLDENSGKGYLGLFQRFCNGLIDEFRAYTAKENIDIVHDGSGFRITPFYATFSELEELAREINARIKPYRENESTPDRQLRNVAIVFTPPAL